MLLQARVTLFFTITLHLPGLYYECINHLNMILLPHILLLRFPVLFLRSDIQAFCQEVYISLLLFYFALQLPPRSLFLAHSNTIQNKYQLYVYLDESLKRYDTVYPAAGDDHSAVKLTIPELEAVSGAAGWVDVCKDEQGEV